MVLFSGTAEYRVMLLLKRLLAKEAAMPMPVAGTVYSGEASYS